MPDANVFDLPETNSDSKAPAPASDSVVTEIQQWEDDGGALPPERETPSRVERVKRKKKRDNGDI
jgi:hypothetical protein